jgi:hypothetical protein
MTTTCPTAPVCSMEGDIRELKEDNRAIRQEVASLRSTLDGRVSAVFTEISKINTKLDNLIEGVRIGAIVPQPPTQRPSQLGWDKDEDTGLHQVSEWAQRAKSTAELLEEEQERAHRAEVEAAALRAKLAERDAMALAKREQEKLVGEWSVKKWQLVLGAVVTLLGAGGGLAAIVAKLLGM